MMSNPFKLGLNDDSTSTKAMLLLAASASISWVFAKSIQNASLVREIGGHCDIFILGSELA